MPTHSHFNSVDVKLCGYDMPANKFVFTNTTSIHLDEDTFVKPREFRPDRFIFTTMLVQRFEFVVPEGKEKIYDIGEAGITYMPKPFKVCAIPR